MSRVLNSARGMGGRGAARGAKPRRGNPQANRGNSSQAQPTEDLSVSTPDIDAGLVVANDVKRFADLTTIHPRLMQNIPFETCSEVQAATIPVSIEGNDVMAQAKTGTGKTLAFLIPAIHHLLNQPGLPQKSQTSVLVLSPTRELASQIGVAAEGLVKDTGLGIQTVIGGTNIKTDVKHLQSRRADILIATPGRLVDLIDNEGIGGRFSKLATLVLDEADRLLDQGFRNELMKIIATLPKREVVDRQTLLFTATVPDGIRKIASVALKPSHKFITTLSEDANNTHEHVTQEVLVVDFNDIVAATSEVLRKEHTKGPVKIMAFLPTARSASIYNEIFANMQLPYPTWEIHSRMSQSARGKATEAFRAAKEGVLFSSDVTARGIDVKGVTAVVQVGLPSNEEQYIHRLGRTARAGEEGHGILILGSFEESFLRLPIIRALPLQETTISPDTLASARSQVSVALQSVSNTAKAQAYQAWLGYYNSSLRVLGWDKSSLVENGNQYALEVLQYDDGGQVPPMEAKTVGKMGLKGTRGLRITSGPSGGGRQGGFQSGQGSATGGRGQPGRGGAVGGGGGGGFGGGRGGGGAGRGGGGSRGRGGPAKRGGGAISNGNGEGGGGGDGSRKRPRPVGASS